MLLGKFSKAPADRKRYTISYSDWLDTGELVSNVTFGVTPSEVGGVVIDGIANNPDGKGVVFYASGGVDATTYKVFATLITSGTQTREDTIQFTARAP